MRAYVGDGTSEGHLVVRSDSMDPENFPKTYEKKDIFQYVIEKGYLAIFELMVKDLTDKNPILKSGRCKGFSLIHLIANEGKLNMLKRLISYMEDKNPVVHQDIHRSGFTPLHFANLTSVACKIGLSSAEGMVNDT